MKRRIFYRLLTTYLGIIILVVALLALGLTQFFSYFYFQQKEQQLTAAGEQVETLVNNQRLKGITEEELAQSVNTIGAVTGSRVLVLQNDDRNKLRSLAEQLQTRYGQKNLGRDLDSILQGRTVVEKRQYLSVLNSYVLFVGLPIRLEGAVKGMVLLFAPINQINRSLLQIYLIIWGTALISLLIAALVIYFTSRRISRPMVQMKQAAVSLAEGNFYQDLPIEGDDEIAELASTFNYMKGRLQQVETMRQELLANVSHELRTPLTSIKGFIQGILDGVIPPQQERRYLQLAFEESERLTRLVHDLLELAKLQSGSRNPVCHPTPVSELASKAAEELQLAAAGKGVSLRVEVPAGLTIRGDRDMMHQVLLNLCSNSLKYTAAGGEIKISAEKREGCVVIRVTDNGSGIPAGELESIFEKFHRVDPSRDASTGGTGLGLAIAKEIVTLHGGRIAAHSRPGEGSEMEMEFPE